MWESRGRSPLGKVRRQQQKPSQSQHSPKQTQHPKMRGCQKQANAQKPPHLSNAQTQPAPHFLPHVLLMSAKPAKSEAILRRSAVRTQQGRQPLPSPALSMIIISKSLLCTAAYRFCAFHEFVQGRAPLKGFACGRHTRKIPLSQGFSSFKTVHRTVLKFTFFGAPYGWGFRRLRSATIGAARPPRPPSATAGASLHPALFNF